MLDGDGTDLHTGAAGGAGPQRIVGDDASHHWLVVRFLLANILICTYTGHTKLAPQRLFTEDLIAMDEERLLHPQNDLLGEEWLACIGRWADRVTAPTFGAGVAIEQLLPGELLGL